MARRLFISLLLAALLATALPSLAAAADPPLPDSMAAVGDSITQAASSAGSLGADAPQNSWSTGTSSTVNSHYLRLLAAGATISGQNHNRSVSGAKMGDLVGQVQTVLPLAPDYLTVLMGGNDLCTDTVAEMTDPTVFRDQFDAAMATLTAGSPNTRVYVVSIPDVWQLWNLFKGNWWARVVWASADICQSLLANPTSTQQADVDRREAVRQRNIAYNAALASVCSAYASCRFDGNAVFNTTFTSGDVSGDYFHPSVAGQAKLAAVSWAAGYTWAPAPPSPMWLSGFAGSGTASKGSWTASATATVSSAAGPVSGATVTVLWSTGTTVSCVTATSGSCSVSSGSLGKRTTSINASVTAISRTGYEYASASNTTASSITIAKP
ncbi:MAG TPA: GDSL-type esterase/lipase family protein [Candidatus Limnocylindria bacterium]|nr:GDSL-type esterase/lipase family protein [Candidatus Limnocylindria bacterium]